MPEDKARKRAVRARMAETGERYTTAARRLGEIPPAPPDPAYTDLVKDDPPLAEREWATYARVRIRSDYPGSTPSMWHDRERPPQPGEVLVMNQHGRAGREIDRSSWWTSFDIDGAVIIGAEHVQVLEVTKVSAPTYRGAALPADQVAAILGPGTEAWTGLGVLVIAGLFDFEVRAAYGELVGLVERGGHGPDRDRLQAAEPVTYRAVIRAGALEAWPSRPPSVRFPPGFMPPDPVRTAADERARWNPAGH